MTGSLPADHAARRAHPALGDRRLHPAHPAGSARSGPASATPTEPARPVLRLILGGAHRPPTATAPRPVGPVVEGRP